MSVISPPGWWDDSSKVLDVERRHARQQSLLHSPFPRSYVHQKLLCQQNARSTHDLVVQSDVGRIRELPSVVSHQKYRFTSIGNLKVNIEVKYHRQLRVKQQHQNGAGGNIVEKILEREAALCTMMESGIEFDPGQLCYATDVSFPI